MADDFDKFIQEHSQEQQGREKLSQETKPEWAVLKGLVSRFALDGKEFSGHKFEWAPYAASRSEFLRLNDVAVIFLDQGERNGVPLNCRVRFTRRPLEPGRMWVDNEAPLEPLEWSLEPQIEGENLVWSVPKLGATLSSANLAEKIAIELSKYHAAYEKAYGRWSAA
ncbi:MAG TPA: hypothetical protein VGK24_14525 [Candidatus Angelobacter sp.]|jgi:hypothetical protein